MSNSKQVNLKRQVFDKNAFNNTVDTSFTQLNTVDDVIPSSKLLEEKHYVSKEEIYNTYGTCSKYNEGLNLD